MNDDNNVYLNEERSNIQEETNKVNSLINEEQATNVNNQIKENKKNPFLRFLLVVIFLAIAVLITYEGVTLSKKFIESGKTTTTTKVVSENNVSKYLNDYSKARKFLFGNNYIILAPKVDNLYNIYISFQTSDNGIIKKEIGTYTIKNDTLYINGFEGEERVLLASETGLVTDGVKYVINDDEFKYYKNESEILILNATDLNSFALHITRANCLYMNYEESLENITLENGSIFTKKGNTVNREGIILTQ